LQPHRQVTFSGAEPGGETAYIFGQPNLDPGGEPGLWTICRAGKEL
jgi:hypothetical protein